MVCLVFQSVLNIFTSHCTEHALYSDLQTLYMVVLVCCHSIIKRSAQWHKLNDYKTFSPHCFIHFFKNVKTTSLMKMTKATGNLSNVSFTFVSICILCFVFLIWSWNKQNHSLKSKSTLNITVVFGFRIVFWWHKSKGLVKSRGQNSLNKSL